MNEVHTNRVNVVHAHELLLRWFFSFFLSIYLFNSPYFMILFSFGRMWCGRNKIKYIFVTNQRIKTAKREESKAKIKKK